MKFKFPHQQVLLACLFLATSSPYGWAQGDLDQLDQSEGSSEQSDAEVAAPSSPSRVLDEIIVTAQKRAENLQDVPVSVAVVSGDDIEARGLDNLEDIVRSVPNVSATTENIVVQFHIRGMGTGQESSASPSVTVILDEVPYSGKGVGILGYLDVERMEMLRGPQGTLMGKETVAGAIHVVTRAPQNDWEFKGNAQFSDFNAQRFEGAVNIPVIEDRFAIRAAGLFSKRDGYMFNTYTDEEDGETEAASVLLKTKLWISDNIDITLNARYGYGDFPKGYGYQSTKATPEFAELAKTADPDFETNIDFQSSRNLAEHAYYTVFIQDAHLSWDIGEYNVEVHAGHSSGDLDLLYDADYSPLDLVILDSLADGSEWLGEIKLTSPATLFNDHFSFLTGIFASRDQSNSTANFHIGPAAGLLSGLLGIPDPTAGDPAQSAALTVAPESSITTTTFGIYGQGTWNLTENWDVIGGIRYSTVGKEAELARTTTSTAGVPYEEPSEIIAALLGDNFRAGDASGQTRFDKAWSVKFSIRYHFGEDQMLFGTYATGFKPGGFGLNIQEDGTLASHDSEFSDTYEIGLKSMFFEGLARVNLTAFWTDYEDLQVELYDGLSVYTGNAGTARTRGVELESQWLLPGNLMLGVNGAYLDAVYTKYEDAPCPDSEAFEEEAIVSGTCDLTGRRLTYAPEWAVSVFLAGEWQVMDLPVVFSASADTSYNGDITFQADTDANNAQEGYWHTNARIGLRDENYRWQVMAFVDNITDETFLVYGNDIFVPGNYWGSVSSPRIFSVSLSSRF